MLGKIILEQRKLLNIKSKHLAETVGIDPGFLTHIEKGDRNPSKSVLAKICKELHLSYEFMLKLLGWKIELSLTTSPFTRTFSSE